MQLKPTISFFVMVSFLLAVFSLPVEAADSGNVTVADGVKSIKNITYATRAVTSQQLDLYLPEPTIGTPPLVIIIHGGAWYAGDKGDFAGQCRGFAQRGYAAASLNYRFSNQAIFPAPIIDCKAAIRWLRANAAPYHFDPKRIVVGGHSAGGHLAALLGVTNGFKAFDAGAHLRESSDVQAVIWLAGVSDFVTSAQMPGYEGGGTPDSDGSRLIGGAVLLNKEKALRASPISYVSRRSVPFIFFHGARDGTVPFAQAAEMYGALTAYGIPCELHPIEGGDHNAPANLTPERYDQIQAFLSSALKWAPPVILPKQ